MKLIPIYRAVEIFATLLGQLQKKQGHELVDIEGLHNTTGQLLAQEIENRRDLEKLVVQQSENNFAVPHPEKQESEEGAPTSEEAEPIAQTQRVDPSTRPRMPFKGQ